MGHRMKCSLLIFALVETAYLLACGGGGNSTPPPPTTYTIGGAVSGLSGSGLVLEDNGGDNLSIKENGEFTFATPIVSGGTYHVTIAKQPSSPLQICLISNGSGSANSNITNVQVTCVGAYTIGGIVSGLTGTGLVLQDNSGDNLQINGNGVFNFATPIASGGTYDVTVLTQPSNQTCAVSSASGTANENITSVLVTCVSSEEVLYSFNNTPDGSQAEGNLVLDSSGNLYGTTVDGGAYGHGTVYKLTPGKNQWTETVLYSFCPQITDCTDGASPQSTLVLDTAGNLYGTSTQGGTYGEQGGFGDGVVFELISNPDGTWAESVLHSFGNGNDGSTPLSGLTFDESGNLYGTTSSGGTGGPNCFGGCGTVFELSPGLNGQWNETVLYNFCSQADCVDGNSPDGVLIFDKAGNLYGTTIYGGTPEQHLNGTVFELTPGENAEWTETVLYEFQDTSTDGANPHAGVIIDQAGNLYGTTELGYETSSGLNNGIIFELTRGQGGQWTEKILHAFCSMNPCSDGSAPVTGLVFDQAGNLYGTTVNAGIFDWGIVFELTPGTNDAWTEIPRYSFQGGADGGGPLGGVILDSAGNLYGAAPIGGVHGYGVVYEVTNSGDTQTQQAQKRNGHRIQTTPDVRTRQK